ncbi:hypothetical protein LR48_Vigan02g254300 [Vigna angularis]|uniref:TF-B3 domain-containing protein n=1 Tax=Phaseolus angularis TaxID=3914 RepID=A0A0L9U0N8_PHAAN|nr:hypothetical protein LR48_Vigan02g254300 [Vigna angularis]
MASQILRTDATLPIFFFKVILKTNLERLKIPNKFTRKYGDGLPNPLLMKLSNGTAWEVKWAKHNREVWLEKGWKEFVQHYSLDHGHLVCFKYEGTSQIHVIIFDQSAVEIDYFCGTDDENDNLVQTEDTADENDNLVQTEDKPNMILDEETQQKAEQIGGENYAQRTSSLNWPTQTRAREIASNFVSCNPFFTVFIKPCHERQYRLKIPNIFTANYGGGLPNPLFMKLPNGTEWKVIWEKDSGEIWLREGWKEFVEHYSLDHGHFVFFKYEGTSEVHVNICDQSGVEIDYLCGTGDGNYNLDQNEEEPIIILDEEEDPEQIRGETSVQRTSSLNRPSQTRAREVACNFVSCNPFFTVFIKPSHGKDYRLRVKCNREMFVYLN